jgi:DHA2 family multidrug resistance protein-like MFS transporter
MTITSTLRQAPSPRLFDQGTGSDGLAQPRRFWAMLAVTVAVAMATLNIAIANMALPIISRDLNVSAAQSVWVILSYQLVMVATILPFAALGEIAGHRRVYLFGIALFTAASLACALAPSLSGLCIARGVQGLGASALVSVNTALVRYIYPARYLGRGVGLTALVVAVCFALGPSLAAAIMAVMKSWGWLFAINVPFGAAALVLAFRALPDTPRRSEPLEYKAVLLNAGTFGLLSLALGQATQLAGWTEVVPELAGALLFLWGLIQHQKDKANPIFPIDLFRIRAFALSAGTAFCAFAAQGLAFVSLPFLLQAGLGRSVVETGLLLTPWPLAVGVMGIVAGRLSDRYPAGILGSAGLVLLAGGLAAVITLPQNAGAGAIVWRLAVCGLGFGFFQSPNLRALMTSAPQARSGGASGIVAMARLSGQTTGAALAALALGLGGAEGPAFAAALAAIFAVTGAVASVLRLR